MVVIRGYTSTHCFNGGWNPRGMLGFRGIRQIISWALGQGIYLLAAKWENQAH